MIPIPHAMSRYAAVTERLIEKCQQDYRAGRNLGRSAPSLSQVETAILVEESLEADQLIRLPLETLAQHAREGSVSDWSLAVLAEIFFARAEDTDPNQDVFAQIRHDEYRDLAWTALENALDSSTASPMLWYEQLYFEVGQQYRQKRDQKAIDLMKRALGHNLRFNSGSNAANSLRDLAETYLWLDELNAGLTVLSRTLRHDPADIWVYNLMALSFDEFGLADLGQAAIQRGLALLQAKGDEHGLENQLTASLEDMQQSEKRGREVEVDPDILADIRQALALDFDAGRQEPVQTLCREVVPDLDDLPLKTAKSNASLPRPEVGPAASLPPQKNLGRNDPCWCGSGKKYKKCHLRTDQKG